MAGHLLAGGTTLTAAVVEGVTEIECGNDHSGPNSGPTAARSSSDGDDDGGDGHGHDHGHDHGDGDGDGAHGNSGPGDGPTCTVANLTVGAVVHEAEIKTMGGKAVFTKIEVIPAALPLVACRGPAPGTSGSNRVKMARNPLQTSRPTCLH